MTLAAPQKRLFIGTSKPEQPSNDRILITLDELFGEYPRAPLEFFDRALLNIARIAAHPAKRLVFSTKSDVILFSEGNYGAMVDQLIELGYLKAQPGLLGHHLVTGKGWERVERLNSPGKDSRQAFVAMWFDESCRKVFEKGIQPAIEADEAFRALRIDRKEHNGKIDDEIIAEIRRSRFLVADFAGDRGGVYYEAGFARGLGLPVILCVPEAELAKVHFDTRQYNHIVYTDAEDLRVKLLNRIRATIV